MQKLKEKLLKYIKTKIAIVGTSIGAILFGAAVYFGWDNNASSQPLKFLNELNQLSLEEEDRCSDYNKEGDYKHPRSKKIEPTITKNQGDIIFDPYSMEVFDDHSEVDIEHIVATSEGHDSGMCGRTREEKTDFASDLLNLAHSDPFVNRSKSGSDYAEWSPPATDNECWYAYTVVQVKTKYGLSVDKNEYKALYNTLSTCKSVDLVLPY